MNIPQKTLEETVRILRESHFIKKHRLNPTAFTRRKKLPFEHNPLQFLRGSAIVFVHSNNFIIISPKLLKRENYSSIQIFMRLCRCPGYFSRVWISSTKRSFVSLSFVFLYFKFSLK